MITIAPSLLASDFLNIESELMSFNGVSNLWFHLDVMDGHFVPNLTFGQPIIELITKKSPHKCDAHFMVTNPEFHGETLKNAGLHNFTFHIEATLEPMALLGKLKSWYASVGVSIKPMTSVACLSDEMLKAVDLVLVMSVEPGFGGQSFMPESIQKIAELKRRREVLNASFVIQIDGGITDKNCHDVIEAGADNLVAGSYIFKVSKDNYKKQVESLRSKRCL